MKTVLMFTIRETIRQNWEEALQDNYEAIPCTDEYECIHHLHAHPESIILLHSNSFEGEIGKFLKKVRNDYPEAHMMLLSDVPHYQEGIIYLRMGVNGYGNSYIHRSHLLHALSVIADGNVWLYPKFLDILLKETLSTKQAPANNALSRLSKREREIAEFVAQGLNNQEIAERTQITVRTVKAHITSIFEKLNLPDRLSLALLMREQT